LGYRGTQVTFPSTLTEGYTYDAMNNLLAKTDRKGQTINYGYDALYRLTSKTYPDQTAVGAFGNFFWPISAV
jgi:YD repeat-containing protein